MSRSKNNNGMSPDEEIQAARARIKAANRAAVGRAGNIRPESTEKQEPPKLREQIILSGLATRRKR